MRMLRTTVAIAAAALIASAAFAAPRSWLLPSETQFTGSGDEWVTVDAALSTDLYNPDHPAQAWDPVAVAPDGGTVDVENKAKGKLRSTFDLHVTQKGTYKIVVLSDTVMGSYLLDGERKMLPRGTTVAGLAQAVPAGATDVQSAQNNVRLETFVTAGEPTTKVFKPSGKGLEMVPVTHPTELAVGEAATFQFLLDGKPAAGITVSAVNGGVRYSGRLEQIEQTTGADGKVTIKWPKAGMWWVSASIGAPRGEGGPAGPAGASGPSGPGTPGAPGAGPQGGPDGPRMMGPPQRRALYAMTVEVLG